MLLAFLFSLSNTTLQLCQLLLEVKTLSANAVRYPGRTQIRIGQVPLPKTRLVPLVQEGFNHRVESVVVLCNYDAPCLILKLSSVVEKSVKPQGPQTHSYPSLNLEEETKYLDCVKIISLKLIELFKIAFLSRQFESEKLYTYCWQDSVRESIKIERILWHSVVIVKLRGHVRRVCSVSRDRIIDRCMLCR